MRNGAISVIVPTLQAEAHLPGLLHALRAQSLPPTEIIVIDSSSRDGTVAATRAAACRVEVIPRASFNHGGTRNLAARLATGEFLVFLTQDVTPADSHFLEALVEPLRQGCAAAFARQLPREGATPPERFLRQSNYPPQPARRRLADLPRLGVKTFFFSNAASAIARNSFETVGGFPEDVVICEDILLSARLIRAGFEVVYAADARVYHSHCYTVSGQFRRYFDIGVTMGRAKELLAGAPAGGEGARFLAGQFRYLLAGGHWRWLPYCAAEAAAKLTAFQLGKHEHLLPRALKEHLSLNPAYWRRPAETSGAAKKRSLTAAQTQEPAATPEPD